MITYKVAGLTMGATEQEFDTPREAVEFAFHAFGYDHECKIYLMDSQGSGGVELAYQWLNKVHVSPMAGSDFVSAVREVCQAWPYEIAS